MRPQVTLVQRLLRLILVPRRVSLLQTILILRDLVLDLGRSDLREELPGLDVIADIDIALQHIAAGAGINICRLEAERRGGQCHVHLPRRCATASTRTLGTKSACCSAVSMTCRCCW